MTGPLQFRPARPEEAGVLGELARAVWVLAQPPAPSSREELPDFTVTVHPGRPIHAWVATADGQPVAFVAVVSWGRRSRLEHLWVRPEWQRHGIGRELVRRVAEGFCEAGWQELEVLARPGAVGFYHRLGAVDGPGPARIDGVVPLVLQLAATELGSGNGDR